VSTGLSVKAAVIGGIAAVAVLSQVISGVGQYLDRMAAGREQIREINEAVLQPVSELATRGVNGGNQMVLTDASAIGLYKASAVRYLKVEGMSEGAEKTPFTEAIPPQKVSHEYLAQGADGDQLKAAASALSASGLYEKSLVYVIKVPLGGVKNGGQITAVFSAERLASLPIQTLKGVAPLALGVILLSTLLAWFIGSLIARPITQLAARVEEVATSLDLTKRVELRAGDIALNREAGETASAFNGLLQKLHATLTEVLHNVARVNRAVEQVSALAGTVAAHSEDQSDSSARMAAAMEQSTANLAEIAHNADYLNQAARESGSLSGKGAVIIHQASDEMGVIARTVQEGTTSIEQLGKQSHEISAIVQVIKEIADQTNLLALNAAIEAARAGEQGRGFAVVADEVRKLAERTGQSTTQITDMIAGLQSSSSNAVHVMEDTVRRVDSGVDLARQAGGAITRISDSNSQVVKGVDAISEALRQQNLAYQDIQQHVERIAQMTEENSHSARETARAARDLESLSRSMQEAVSRFHT
jgi:methyl-accepting chemotaxis protein